MQISPHTTHHLLKSAHPARLTHSLLSPISLGEKGGGDHEEEDEEEEPVCLWVHSSTCCWPRTSVGRQEWNGSRRVLQCLSDSQDSFSWKTTHWLKLQFKIKFSVTVEVNFVLVNRLRPDKEGKLVKFQTFYVAFN